MNYDRTAGLIRDYYNLDRKFLKRNNLTEREYNNKVCLEAELRDIVLTGEELVKDKFLRGVLSKEERIRALKQGIRNMGLMSFAVKNRCDDYTWIIKKIESIIEGKQGSIVGNIREALSEHYEE